MTTLLDDDLHAAAAGEPEPPPAEVQAPDERMDPKVELLWQVNAALGWAVWVSLAAVGLFLLDRSPAWASLMAPVGATYVMQVPARRYRHFTFRVGPVDVRVAHGWLWRTESVVLHSRIQHVDTRQGPVERMMGLATVVVFTAGSVGAMVAIPGLATARAEALRDDLVRLSGTDDAV
jgi:membrane protein YdbS with pleckstrin-like domain